MDAERGRRTVVVGVDGSPSALRAARWGAAEAGRRRVPLRLVAAFGWATGQVGEPGDGHDPGVRVEQVLTRTGPGHTLIEQSRRAQLLVVGSRGGGEFAGLVLGSVSNALLHRADCPVAVARHRTAPPG